MGFFSRKPKRKSYQRRTPLSAKEQQEKVEQKKAWDGFVKQMEKDPELEKQFIFQKMGISPLTPQDPADAKKMQLRSTLIEEACKLIGEDDDLRREYAEGMIGELISSKSGRGRSRRDSEYDLGMMESGSSLSHALEEVENLSELKAKLQELGMVEGGENEKGFFGGLKLKDLLSVLPQVLPYLVSGQQGSPAQGRPAETMYVVQVNGRQTRVTESQYQKMLQEGSIKPVGELMSPKGPKEQSEQQERQIDDDGIQVVESSRPTLPMPNEVDEQHIELPPIDFIFQQLSMDSIMNCMDNDPTEFVMTLQIEKENNTEWAQFMWGLLSNVNYEGVLSLVQNYAGDERAAQFIERLYSEEGKAWVEAVIEQIRQTVFEDAA